jgi:hypothetical protein
MSTHPVFFAGHTGHEFAAMCPLTHSALLYIDLPCFVSSCLVLVKVIVFPVSSLYTISVYCRFSFNCANVLTILLIKCKVDITIIDGLS